MAETIATVSVADRATPPGSARKVLIALYGAEPPSWVPRVSRAAERAGRVRVLVVDDDDPPAFTSLLPAARRWFAAALATSRRRAQADREAVLGALLAELPASAEVAHVPAGGDPGRVIAACANAWAADVVVVGRDRTGVLGQVLLGTVHERVLRRARCAVLVVPAGVVRRARRGAPGASLSSRAAAPGGA
jgi:nucleotide-binding universal stress UspA family protein